MGAGPPLASQEGPLGNGWPFFSSDTSPMKTVCLKQRIDDPVRGPRSQWYVAFVHLCGYIKQNTVIHNQDEQDLFELTLHAGIDADLAIDNRWIKAYYVGYTRKTFPRRVRCVRLALHDGESHHVWKRLLGNRLYDEVHRMCKAMFAEDEMALVRKPVPPPRDNTYYGKGLTRMPGQTPP